MATTIATYQLLIVLAILNLFVGGIRSEIEFASTSQSKIRFFKRDTDLQLSGGVKKRFIDDANVDISENTLTLERRKRDVTDSSTTCSGKEFGNQSSDKRSYKFSGDTNGNIGLEWAGENTGVMLLLTDDQYGITPPILYRSEDYGASFTDITSRIHNAFISFAINIQQSPINTNWLILMSETDPMTHKNTIHITRDGGNTFAMKELPFIIGSTILFHPTKAEWLLMTSSISIDDAGLWLSTDFGQSWSKIHNYVAGMRWGNGHFDTKETIYIAVDPKESYLTLLSANEPFTLMKSDDLGLSFTTISEDVYSYSVQDKFLYITRGEEDNNDVRVVHVSTDGGKTWNVAKLPHLSFDKLFMILDMSEGMVFMHVSNDQAGHGTIYTSDSEGIVFAESLQNHFLTVDETENLMTDFYKVKSLRGVYLTSQLGSDDSFSTTISYDRGATWQRIPPPEGVPCDDGVYSDCSLQIHNVYSELTISSVHAGPLSTETATGIILAHGHVARTLKVTQPDVFVTSNGGYTWSKALDGPHFYAILDHGGLLVAVPSEDPDVNILKFSYDEGQCWASFEFADEPMYIQGIVTEPGSKTMMVGIWGYGTDNVWRVITIDFKQFVDKQCGEDDYVEWYSHKNNGKEGCLLGTKETFRRLKPDSFCQNGYSYVVDSHLTACTCTKADYECDYGYYRYVGVVDCIQDHEEGEFNNVLCIDGKKMWLQTSGYRKIPGDNCTGGVQYVSTQVDTGMKCDVDGGFFQKIVAIVKRHKTASTVAAVAVSCVGIVCAAFMVVYFYRKCRQLNGSGRFRYNYSQLNQSDDILGDLEDPRTITDLSYHDDSDVDLIQ